MKQYLAIIRNDMRLALRQKAVIFFNYLMPLAFFFIFAQTFHAEQGGAILTVVITPEQAGFPLAAEAARLRREVGPGSRNHEPPAHGTRPRRGPGCHLRHHQRAVQRLRRPEEHLRQGRGAGLPEHPRG